MPTLQIHMLEGRTVEQKRALVRKVTDAVCESLSIEPGIVKIIIDEMKVEHYAEGGVLRADKKPG